jgi:predicted transcriptional regulator
MMRDEMNAKPDFSEAPTQQLTAKQRLDLIGIDEIAAMIEEGHSQVQVAQTLGVRQSTLNEWLHSRPDRSARARAAMSASAEAWLDNGLRYLLDAPADMAEIGRAKALAQECARRAAVRNPAYRDKVDHTYAGQITHSVEQMTRQQLEQIAAQGLPLVERIDDETQGGTNSEGGGPD